MKNGQRVIGITLLGMIILAGCMLASVAYGSNLIPIGQVLQALQNPDSGTFEASVVWALVFRALCLAYWREPHWAYQVLSCRL